MHVLSCIIVDDEPLQPALLGDYIKKTPFLQLTGIYANPLKALAAAQQQSIDLIFLDIQMPELSGIQFMQILKGKSKVVVISAYPGYALLGYELDVVDYLIKPVSFERFLKASGKALNIIHPPEQFQLKPRAALLADQVLFVKTDYKIVKISLPDILYIEGLKEYIAIHTKQEKIITLQTMKKMEEVLPAIHFTRVHKSFIVAVAEIDSIERSHILIKNNRIPIGDTYKEAFLLFLNDKNLL